MSTSEATKTEDGRPSIKSVINPEEKQTEHQRVFVEVGANLLDRMFSGIYRDRERHKNDLNAVLHRAFTNNVSHIVISAGSLQESKDALNLARTVDPVHGRTFCTVGVHPTKCHEFLEGGGDDNAKKIDIHVQELINLCRDGMSDGTVVALGELGLDYDRTMFCPIDLQKQGFLAQLQVAKQTGLPLFIHNRNTGRDLLNILKEHSSDYTKAVIHSFDDTEEIAHEFLKLGDGIYIGINGCSLKTQQNLEVVKTIPLNRILLETDCPWCDIRTTHAGYKHVQTRFPTWKEKQFVLGECVKNRSEPCHIIQVAEIIAAVKDVSVDEVAEAAYQNSMTFFGYFKRPVLLRTADRK